MPNIPQIPGGKLRNPVARGSRLPGFGVIGRFFGNSVSEAIAFAFGVAVGPVLAPPVELLRQAAWEELPHRLPDVYRLAEGVAQGKVDETAAKAWAKKNGYDGTVFDALRDIAKEGLSIGDARAASRRLPAGAVDLHEVYTRHAIEEVWWPALDTLVSEILDPAQLAAAIHRGLVPDPGLLKGEQPTGPFKVEAYPVYPIDAVDEAKGSGYNEDRLGVLVGLQGLPMGTHEAAQAFFRGIIEHGDYIRAFNESNSRNEWAGAVLDQSRQIPTARDFLENALRGYTDLAEAITGAELHGMSPEHATLIYQNQGRPMNIRQITQALSRGGVFQPEPGEITDPYRASIVEGNLKPAYYDLAEALRYTLPSPFAMRQLATSGVWSEAKTAQRLKDLGWQPDDADEVAAAWAGATAEGSKAETKAELRDEFEGGYITEAQFRAALTSLGYTGATLDHEVHLGDAKRLKTWREKAVNLIGKAFIEHDITEPVALADLAEIRVTGEAAAGLLSIWKLEQRVTIKNLTQAQVRAAYRKAAITQEQALAMLANLGMPADAATAYLAS